MIRKRLLMILLATVLTSAGVWAALERDRSHEFKEVSQLDAESIMSQLEAANVITASATYIDTAGTITEMAAASELIAVVSLVSRRQYSPMAVATTAKVNRVIKGRYSGEEIVIFQIGNLGIIEHIRALNIQPDPQDGLLNVEREYLLFLGKQDDGRANTFYIKGGAQGMFHAEGNRIVAQDTRFAVELSQLAVTGGLTALEHHVRAVLKGR